MRLPNWFEGSHKLLFLSKNTVINAKWPLRRLIFDYFIFLEQGKSCLAIPRPCQSFLWFHTLLVSHHRPGAFRSIIHQDFVECRYLDHIFLNMASQLTYSLHKFHQRIHSRNNRWEESNHHLKHPSSRKVSNDCRVLLNDWR